ncbi:hypothetical protein KFE25_006400 [Diacronema lutheri]|uniref:Uncharacterized protein n=2 Tax=Diacronema lutheri TaxID=2081491 RepID=A0A8J5Y215_DIALT|nr:hypothetical protein KFE25_006400 [Diacronema lutheri]
MGVRRALLELAALRDVATGVALSGFETAAAVPFGALRQLLAAGSRAWCAWRSGAARVGGRTQRLAQSTAALHAAEVGVAVLRAELERVERALVRAPLARYAPDEANTAAAARGQPLRAVAADAADRADPPVRACTPEPLACAVASDALASSARARAALPAWSRSTSRRPSALEADTVEPSRCTSPRSQARFLRHGAYDPHDRSGEATPHGELDGARMHGPLRALSQPALRTGAGSAGGGGADRPKAAREHGSPTVAGVTLAADRLLAKMVRPF